MAFEIQIEESGTRANLKVCGNLNEQAVFGDSAKLSGKDLRIDLAQLQGVNSTGIRNWIVWTQGIPAKSWTLENCPSFFIDQVNMVANFLAPGSVIKSFYVPYFSDHTREEKNVLLIRGEHFLNGKVTKPPEVKDSKGQSMEMDIYPEKYFRFLTKY